MQIKLLFFGALAEIIGESEIILNDDTIYDTESLNSHLIQKYPKIARYKYSLSVNRNITLANKKLNNNDEVGLLPPFAGG